MMDLSLIILAVKAIVIISPIWIIINYYISYYLDNKYNLNEYPGPFLAKFSRIWLAYHARFGKRYLAIHRIHLKYGRYVRIAPNELSILDADAIPIVLGHGTGTIKSKFYDAFVANRRGLFNTRDRIEHARKRKIVSNTFSQTSILEFEPYINEALELFINQLDRIVSSKSSNSSDWILINILPWFNYLAFDIIGDLAFGERFGMLEKGGDIATVERDGETLYLPAIKILNERGEFSVTQGSLSASFRPYTKYLDPWFRRGAASVKNLTGIATNRVNVRLSQHEHSRKDLLARLQAGQDADGNPMGKEELIAESLTQLIAGSDTTSNSSCAILWWVAKHPRVQLRLREELDERLGVEQEGVVSYKDSKECSYLEACIKEGLRLHSTSSIGLPRILPQTVQFKGHLLKEGLVCSIPTFDIHRDPDIWGDSEVYRPERWLEPDAKKYERGYMPFSHGPRACIGRNLAMMELQMIIATIFKRYDIKLNDPDQAELDTCEGFLRKPLNCWIKFKRRN